METYKIETSYYPYRNTMNTRDDWTAELDCFDGAPDTPHGICTAQGSGPTELQAVLDLIETIYDEEILIDLDIIDRDGETDPPELWQEVDALLKLVNQSTKAAQGK